jgi:phosphoglycolate phosphatase
MVKHIIWDWNGTLLDDAAACVDAINVLLRRRKLPAITHAQYVEVFGFPVKDYYLQLGFDFTKDDWQRVAEEYHDVYAVASAQAALRDGARDAVQGMKRAGFRVSVLSACELSLLKRMMQERGILDLFDGVYGLPDLFAHSKMELGRAMLSDMGLAPADALLIGDTTHDFEVAQALACACLLMSGGHQSAAKLKGCGCPVVANCEEALSRVVREYQQS